MIRVVMGLVPMAADAQITSRQTNVESCSPGNDGAATVTLPSSLSGYCRVEWTSPSGGHLTGTSISGLKAGAYSFKVIATACNKPIFQDVVIVDKEDACSIKASISVSTNDPPCDVTPTATLTASASGGVIFMPAAV